MECTSPPQSTTEVITDADFEAIFQQFQGQLLAYFLKRTHDFAQAEDLVQDTFVKAYNFLQQQKKAISAAKASAWLFTIALHCFLDALRRKKLIAFQPLSCFEPDRGIGAGLAPEQDSSDEASEPALYSNYTGNRFEEGVANREIIEKIFQLLPPDDSRCLQLAHLEELSNLEISQRLNTTIAAVKMRLMRAHRRARTIYEQEVAEATPQGNTKDAHDDRA